MHLSFKHRLSEKSREQRSAIRVILFLTCRRLGVGVGGWGGIICAMLDIPIRVKLKKGAAHRRQLSLSEFQSHCCCLCACYSQITAEMPPSIIVVCWPAEKTEMSAGLNSELPKQLFPDRACGFAFVLYFCVCL